MLEISHLSAAYGGRAVLHDICLSVAAGEFVGLIVPNGAGKSSLMRAISGTLALAGGTVRLNGVDLLRLGIAERARQVAVVPQQGHLPAGFSVAEVVLSGRTPHLPRFGHERPHDYRTAQAAMQRTNTWPLAERRVSELSGGERQRVLLARALAQEPRVLLLDEATAHLDIKHQLATLRLAQSLARAGLIVIAAMHDLNQAALFADRLALLHQGHLLACDAPAQVLTSAWIKRAYDITVSISTHPLYNTPLIAMEIDEAISEEQG